MGGGGLHGFLGSHSSIDSEGWEQSPVSRARPSNDPTSPQPDKDAAAAGKSLCIVA